MENYKATAVAQFTGLAAPGNIKLFTGKAGDKVLSIQSKDLAADVSVIFGKFLSDDGILSQIVIGDYSAFIFIVLLGSPE